MLGPTHEEIFTGTVRDYTRSYRDLPLNLYQIQTKYRDEIRPRFGVMRSREFLMKDAYSFDRDQEGLDASYEAMYQAYRRIFDRLGLEYVVIDADSGTMGGTGSQEFTVRSEAGESEIVQCPDCGYAASSEKAQCIAKSKAESEAVDRLQPEAVSTPNARTIAEVTGFLGCRETDLAKTILYRADRAIVAAMVRGDREINEAKLMSFLGCSSLEMADEESEVHYRSRGWLCGTGRSAGKDNCRSGAWQRSKPHCRCQPDRFPLKACGSPEGFSCRICRYSDDCQGRPVPRCGTALEFGRGIEVGHIFKLGTRYSESLGCSYLDESGSEHPWSWDATEQESTGPWQRSSSKIMMRTVFCGP